MIERVGLELLIELNNHISVLVVVVCLREFVYCESHSKMNWHDRNSLVMNKM